MIHAFVKVLLITLLVIGCWSMTGCESPDKTASGKYYLPEAGGDVGEMIVVMDSAKWQGDLGRELRRSFSASVPGLPQDEPYFTLRQVSPRRFNSILKTAKNILIVTSLEGNSSDTRELMKEFTPESLTRIREDTSIFMVSRKDEFAKGQELMSLFAKDDATLISRIKANSDRLVNHFNQIESKRIAQKIFRRREQGVMTRLWDDHKFHIQLPEGYELSKSLPNFAWIRFLDPEFEKNIFIYHEPYTSDEIFTSKDMVTFREEVTQTMIRDIQKPQLYLTYQKELPFHVTEVNFKNKFALETRGLWKFSDSSGGGPFLSYTFVDEKLNRLYYIEGYAYAPSTDKYKFIRELYTILWTFQTESERINNN